jgi:hypothetical protein
MWKQGTLNGKQQMKALPAQRLKRRIRVMHQNTQAVLLEGTEFNTSRLILLGGLSRCAVELEGGTVRLRVGLESTPRQGYVESSSLCLLLQACSSSLYTTKSINGDEMDGAR